MVTHYFVLQALSRELDSALRSATIREVFSQRESELLLVLEHPASQERGTLVISVKPHANYCYLRGNFQRAKRNSIDLFSEALGKVIESVNIQPGERILKIHLDNGWKFILQMFNTAASNVLIVDETNTIREAFKKNKNLTGIVFEQRERRFDADVLTNKESFRAATAREDSIPISGALKKIVPIFGSVYIREILFRAGIEGDLLVQNFNDEMLEKLHHEIGSLLDEISHPQPTLYEQEEGKSFLSIVLLRHLSGARTESFTSVNDAIRHSLVRKFRSEGLESERQAFLEKIRGSTEHYRRALEKATAHRETDRTSEEYERAGETLLSHLDELRKGMTTIRVSDSEMGSVTVSLDPALTPAQNAERYFEKAKKQRAALAESDTRIKELTAFVETLSNLEQALERCRSMDELKEFKRTRAEELKSLRIIGQVPGREAPPFRTFTVAGGYKVWVGKSSANNDLLTMKYAKPNDLWFHVRGAGGSHTVLRSRGDGQPPPKEAIRQAASIAAYYSKMRSAGTVPVAFCERKYVRKPKGMKEGTVVLDREEVIFVKPKLPE